MPALVRSRPEAAALRYAALGWAVLPLHVPTSTGGCSCARPDCAKPGKHPRNRRGVHDASSRAQTIRRWWARWPDANLGVATGPLLIVIDVDGADGSESLRALEADHDPLPATLEALTGRGRHLYFAAPAEPLTNSAGRLGEGIDVRGHGGYVVAPPSRHAAGHHYRWRARRRPVTLPDWITQLLLAPIAASAPTPARLPTRGGDRGRRSLAAAIRGELAGMTSAQPGTRNDTLNRAAFRLAQLAVDDASALQQLEHRLLAAALAAGLAESEARATIASGLTAGQQHPRRQ